MKIFEVEFLLSLTKDGYREKELTFVIGGSDGRSRKIVTEIIYCENCDEFHIELEK